MRFLLTMLFVLVPLSAAGPAPQGGAPKNLKVLKPEEVRMVMGQFVAALGVGQSGGCNFCHVQDRSSDEKPQKVTARMMITMVKGINEKVATQTGEAGKTFVTCYTCHRGKQEPDTAPAGQP